MLKRQEMNSYRTVLSIAGSDSVGGAGIQADIKTCTALGVCAMTAVTALTAQNTQGVSRVAVTDPEMLTAQLRAVADDVRPDAVKTGMLPDAESVELVARFLKEGCLTNVVVDPVMVATSGDSLCEDPARTRLLTLLIPLARVVTPNIPEAETLTGIRISDRASMQLAALHLLRHTGCGAVLLKGGHGFGSPGAVRTERRIRICRTYMARASPHRHPQHPRHGLYPLVGHSLLAGTGHGSGGCGTRSCGLARRRNSRRRLLFFRPRPRPG